MTDPDKRTQILWAKWSVHEDGSLVVSATFAGDGGYTQETTRFSSLAEATELLGKTFADVVNRARAAGSHSGRWRP